MVLQITVGPSLYDIILCRASQARDYTQRQYQSTEDNRLETTTEKHCAVIHFRKVID